MAKFYGEAVSTPNDVQPWAAVMYSDDTEYGRLYVQTRQAAEELIVELLSELEEFARGQIK